MLRILCNQFVQFKENEKSDAMKHGSIITASCITKAYDPERMKNLPKDIEITTLANGKSTIPLNKELMKINAPEIRAVMDNPMRIKVYDNERSQPQVELNTLMDNYTNKANIYIVGVPFNGTIKPIPEDPKYRIYKGALVVSATPFMFHKRSYSKILYLIIEPNLNLFNPDHKYHTDTIELKIESYDRVRPAHETYTLTITNGAGEYKEEWTFDKISQEEYQEGVKTDQLEIWKTFKFEKKEESEESVGRSSAGKKSAKKNHKDYIKGDVLITTNKHGIRKEVPLHNSGRNYRREEAMKYEYDEDYSYHSNRKSGGNKKSKKKQWK